MRDLAVLDDQVAVLEHIGRPTEHFRDVGALAVDRDIGDGTSAEMAAIGEAKQLWRGPPAS